MDFGSWTLYSFKTENPRAEALPYPPTTFYGPISFKDRQITDYDWARFQEVALFSDASSTYLIYPPDQNLDTSPEIDTSSSIIISQYKYHNLDKAYSRLLSFAKNNMLILVVDQDPLFEKLITAKQNDSSLHIIFIERLQQTPSTQDPLQNQLTTLFTKIQTHPKPNNSPLTVTDVSIADNTIKVSLNGMSTTPVPVIIKSSYFPTWYRTDGEPVYLASPTYILTYATSSFTLKFNSNPTPVVVGRISVLLH